MSRNDWEEGTVTLPTRAWSPFKKALMDEWNRQRDTIVRQAERFQSHLAEHFKGKRGVDRHDVKNYLWDCAGRERLGDEMAHIAIELTLSSLKDGSASRTKKLTQAMINKQVGPKATIKTTRYEGSLWAIVLNNEKKQVLWIVEENNHAVEESRSSAMGARLFRELNRIDYGNRKQHGGYIVGNDEYNCDDTEHGSGANYLTATFGKAGEIERGW